MYFGFAVIVTDGLEIESPLFDMFGEEPASGEDVDLRVEDIAFVDAPLAQAAKMDGVDLHQSVIARSVVVETDRIGIAVALDHGDIFEEQGRDIVVAPRFFKIGLKIGDFGKQR